MLIMSLMVLDAKGQKISYDLQTPEIFPLPDQVDEISGITFLNDSTLLAVDDEHGQLFKLMLQKNVEISGFRFGEDKDYEGIARVDSDVYILQSKGNLYRFLYNDSIHKTEKIQLELKGKNQFEAFYYDGVHQKLVLICKKCDDDTKVSSTAWAYDLSTSQFDHKAYFTIERAAIEAVYGKPIKRFKPSAAALHPITRDIYIVSSINKLMVIMNNNTKAIISVISLDKSLFKQPEGIAFNSMGDLVISNEAAGEGAANLLLFRIQEHSRLQ